MATNFIKFEKRPVAGSSALKATTSGHILDIVVVDDELNNGVIIKKGEYVEMKKYKQGAASTTFVGKVVEMAANGNYYVEVVECDEDLLVLQVPTSYHDYTAQMRAESNFYNVKDDVVRAYELHVHDIFELSVEGFVAEPEIGATVKMDAGEMKLAVQSD